MKSKIFIVRVEVDEQKTVCWLGDDKFSEDIKHFDPEDPNDFDLATLDSTIARYFEMGELTEDKDLIGQELDGLEIKAITYQHEIN
ncbi:MAG: hypothetical protein GY861_05090 [bacterium]|nr:hypothetical protein [bacterium]